MTEKPLLIFDGDCGFCRRWIARWMIITGGRIDFAPYQQVGLNYPQIPADNFKASVQLVEKDRVTCGAEAVFRTLAYDPGRKWLLGLYQHVPGVKAVTEAFYAL